MKVPVIAEALETTDPNIVKDSRKYEINKKLTSDQADGYPVRFSIGIPGILRYFLGFIVIPREFWNSTFK
jgi:hypothetical protein